MTLEELYSALEEADKRANFTKSRRDNGNKGGRPKTTIKPNDIPKKNLMVNHMTNHIEDENVNETVIENRNVNVISIEDINVTEDKDTNEIINKFDNLFKGV
jgi:hypothetical protein